jgi:hypothetical protein
MRTSQALAQLLKDASRDRIEIGWIANRLEGRSFGFFMLVLAFAGLAPGIASISGFLLALPALQMLAGRNRLTLPRSLAARSADSGSFARWINRMIPVFAWIEALVPAGARHGIQRFTRLIGALDLLLALAIIVPVPFAYIPPTLAIMALSFAQIEDSALLLAIACMIALAALLFVGTVSFEVFAFLFRAIGL